MCKKQSYGFFSLVSNDEALDKDLRFSISTYLIDISRMSAPIETYKDDIMREILQLIIDIVFMGYKILEALLMLGG